MTGPLAEGWANPDTITSLVEFLGDVALSVTDRQRNSHFAELLPEIVEAVATAYPVVLSAWDLHGAPNADVVET
ncbi:hypothetical protein [Couchioplanes caeruleus]|uniref:hypothetical protein n=1 Tax=Couchioplanes caeruleus TaxID=56438 RepID=UPI001B8695E9|nr:hypothetical protein [Couchioplanes caeruleus]